MFIEIFVSDLLETSPMDVVRYVLSSFLGTFPPEEFLCRHADAINRDEIAFLEHYLKQWPGAFRSHVERQQNGVVAMEPFEDLVSVGFLMSLPSDSFLEALYGLLFDRELDDGGLSAYGAYDFNDPTNREIVINAMLQSQEFRDMPRPKTIAGPPAFTKQFRSGVTGALYWDTRVQLNKTWYFADRTVRPLVGQYTPLILWVPDRTQLYCVAGMQLSGELEGNVLRARPEWSIWGPKAPLPAGNYVLKLHLSGASQDMFILDVCSEGGMNNHRTIEYFGSINMQIPLQATRDLEELEVRVFNYTGRTVDVVLHELSISSLK